MGVFCQVWGIRTCMTYQHGRGRIFDCLLLVLNFDLVYKICLSSNSSLWNSPVSVCSKECLFSYLWIGIRTKLKWKLMARLQVPLSLGSKSFLTFLVLRNCLDSFGEPRFVVTYITFGSQCSSASWVFLKLCPGNTWGEMDHCVLTWSSMFSES